MFPPIKDLPVEIQELITCYLGVVTLQKVRSLFSKAIQESVENVTYKRVIKNSKDKFKNIKFLLARNVTPSFRELRQMISEGDLRLIQLLHENKVLNNGNVSFVNYGGNIPTLQWLVSAGYKLTINMFVYAIIGGHLDCVKWYMSFGFRVVDIGGRSIIGCKSIQVLIFLLENGYEPTVENLYNRAPAGNLQILQWFVLQGIPLNETVLKYAIDSGNYKCVRFCLSMNVPVDNLIISIKQCENIKIMKLLRANHFTFTQKNLMQSIHNFNFAVFRWLVAVVFVSDQELLQYCIQANSAYCVITCLHDNCVMPESPCRYIDHCTDLKTLNVLYDHGYKPTYKTMRQSAKSGKLQCLKWLLSIGCDIDDKALDYAIDSNSIACVAWCFEQGCKPHEHTLQNAVNTRNVDMLRFLKSKSCTTEHLSMKPTRKCQSGVVKRWIRKEIINRYQQKRDAKA